MGAVDCGDGAGAFGTVGLGPATLDASIFDDELLLGSFELLVGFFLRI